MRQLCVERDQVKALREVGSACLIEAFDDLRFELWEFRDLGDELLAFGRVHGHGTESGIEIDSPLAWLIRAKDGKAIWVGSYLDPKEALKAAGLSE